MTKRKMADLITATEIPNDDELIVPVFHDHTDNVTRKISVSELAKRIRERVMKGESIIMEQVANGIKFRKG